MQSNGSIEQKIGKRIRKIRKSRRYTQETLAEMVGISTNYLSDIERGNSFPRIDKLVAIINILECTADDLFADVITIGYKVKSSRLSEQLATLSSEDQEKAFAILEAFIGNKL